LLLRSDKMKKLFLLLLLFIPHIIFADDIYYKVIKETPFWRNFPRPDNISGYIEEGVILKEGDGSPWLSKEYGGKLEDIPLQKVIYNDEQVDVYANSLLPLETQDMFDTNLLFNPENILVYSFYVNALLSNNREIIYLNDKPAWDYYIDINYDKDSDLGHKSEWWELATASRNLLITQTAINIDPDEKAWSRLIIKNIEKTNEGYKLTVKERATERRSINRWNWSNIEKGKFFTLVLIPDGDYIDLYYMDKNTLIDTFVFVNQEFINQLRNLIKGNHVDLTNVKFPKRADGSTGDPPPIDISDYTAADTANDIESENQTEITASYAEKDHLPLWAWFAIGIGAVAVIGGAVFVAVKRK